jgi:predicted glycosyltransferase
MKRIFFHVQHLLGIGHIRRAAVLARTLAASGFDVLLVSGGAPLRLDIGGARLHQLPPLRARDAGLRELSRLDGAPIDDPFRTARTRELLDLFRAEVPDVLITEQFPFGRTQLRFELLPLLEAAQARRPKPLIVSSVRDVVRRSVSPQRVQETIDLLQLFDLVLIHGDPTLIGFDRSFAGWKTIRDRALYTGYVADAGAPSGDAGKDEVIVSVGGGAVGKPLIEAAAAARGRSVLADRTWRLLGAASATCADGVIAEPARADFTTLLRNAALSISRRATTPWSRRWRAPIGRCWSRSAPPARPSRPIGQPGSPSAGWSPACQGDALSADTLAAAVDRAMQAPSIRRRPPCDLTGAATTASLLHQRLA